MATHLQLSGFLCQYSTGFGAISARIGTSSYPIHGNIGAIADSYKHHRFHPDKARPWHPVIVESVSFPGLVQRQAEFRG